MYCFKTNSQKQCALDVQYVSSFIRLQFKGERQGRIYQGIMSMYKISENFQEYFTVDTQYLRNFIGLQFEDGDVRQILSRNKNQSVLFHRKHTLKQSVFILYFLSLNPTLHLHRYIFTKIQLLWTLLFCLHHVLQVLSLTTGALQSNGFK